MAPSPRQTTQAEHHLAQLPALAARATRTTNDGTRLRPTPHGSRLPHGVNLDLIDRSKDRAHPLLLARLSQCIRAICEEMPTDIYLNTPPLTAEGHETWTEECDWLLATAHWWTTTPWQTGLDKTGPEWVTEQVTGVRQKLILHINHLGGIKLCLTCATDLTCYRMGQLGVAACPHCDRPVRTNMLQPIAQPANAS